MCTMPKLICCLHQIVLHGEFLKQYRATELVVGEVLEEAGDEIEKST